jgi:hypothetical protein
MIAVAITCLLRFVFVGLCEWLIRLVLDEIALVSNPIKQAIKGGDYKGLC